MLLKYIYTHIIKLTKYQLNYLLIKTQDYEKIYFCGNWSSYRGK